MTRVTAFVNGVWDFVVGDDWRIALGVVLALGVTAAIAKAGGSAWWVMPLAVCGILVFSIRRAARDR
jgi:hydrogenase/urease accessory protein HupE